MSMPTRDEITTLFDIEENKKLTLFQLKTKKIRSFFAKKYLETKADFQKGTLAYKWVVVSLVLFSVTSVATIIYPVKISPKINHKYSIYASRPLTFGNSEYEIYSKDSRSQKINEIFKEFNCPLEGLGEIFVYEADKNHIPWWITAAIAFQESSCGKMTPEPEGIESYNAWGWGVYGDNVQSFDNWVRGVETVSEYLREKFYTKNIKDPCDIMKVYTPPSNGSWCEGVNYFGDLIQNYKTPIDNDL